MFGKILTLSYIFHKGYTIYNSTQNRRLCVEFLTNICLLYHLININTRQNPWLKITQEINLLGVLRKNKREKRHNYVLGKLQR